MVNIVMARTLEVINKDAVSFAFFLCLSILGHALVFIYLQVAPFSTLGSALPKATKLKTLSVQLMQAQRDPPELVLESPAAVTEILSEKPITPEPATPEPPVIEPATTAAASKPEPDAMVGSESTSILTAKYFSLAELDEIPEPQNTIDIESLNLLQYAQGGKVELRLWVDEQGQVVDVEVVNSEMPLEFVESATKLFKQAQFYPGMVNSAPVKFVTKVVIRYEPH
jgi:TonB family protein